MADDTSTQRSVRPGDRYGRGAASPGVDNAANDPLAELARLIGQTDPFAEFGSEARRSPPVPPSNSAYQAQVHEPHAAASQHPHSAYDHFEQTGTQNPDEHEVAAYYEEDGPPADDGYLEGSSSRRRLGILTIAGVFALGVIGTAGAFGYRALFGPGGSPMPPPVIKADATPSKIVPQKGDDRKTGGKVIYDRVGDRGQDEKVVSREETPLDIKNKPGVVPMPASDANGGASGAMQAVTADSSFPEPKKIHTIVIRPDQPDMGLPPPSVTASAGAVPAAPPPPSAAITNPPDARVADAEPQQRAPESQSHREAPPPRRVESAVTHRAQTVARNAPLSLSPGGQTNSPPVRQPTRVANAPAAAPASHASETARAHGAFVQVSSQRSEADAQASFRSLQGKYPKQLGGRHLVVHRVDLGKKGVYYRALVGPFASAGEAAQLCGNLKAAGGNCLIQRN